MQSFGGSLGSAIQSGSSAHTALAQEFHTRHQLPTSFGFAILFANTLCRDIQKQNFAIEHAENAAETELKASANKFESKDRTKRMSVCLQGCVCAREQFCTFLEEGLGSCEDPSLQITSTLAQLSASNSTRVSLYGGLWQKFEGAGEEGRRLISDHLEVCIFKMIFYFSSGLSVLGNQTLTLYYCMAFLTLKLVSLHPNFTPGLGCYKFRIYF